MSWQNYFSLAGGLALFLFGMKMMGDELERAAGSSLRRLLDILTRNRFMGLLVGLVFTMLVQSSSATSVMVIGFVNAGLMNMYQAAGVILGANIGTTITAQLIAFNLSDIAPLFLLAGVIILMFVKRTQLKQVGGVIAGFGMLFVGLSLMSSSMAPLRDMPEVVSLMSSFKNPLLGVLVGAGVTAIIQSSSASVGILQVLAAQGAIGLDAAVYVVLGQNIGTTVTALIASIGAGKAAKRTAVMHMLIKVFGAVIFLIILRFVPYVEWLEALSPGDPMRQIANAHMIYNIINVGIMFPFINPIVKLASMIVPGQDKSEEDLRLKYLSDSVLNTPPAAIMQALKEIKRMQRLAYDNIDRAMMSFLQAGASKVENELEHDEAVVDYLSNEITKYLIRISQSELQPHEATLVGELYHVVTDVERIGDHAENILEYAQRHEEEKVVMTEAALGELSQMYAAVKQLLELAYEGFDAPDEKRVNHAYAIEQRVDDMEKEYNRHHIERMSRQQCSPISGMLFTNLLMNLERVADHAINIVGSEEKA